MEGCVAGVDDGFFRKGWSRCILVLAAHCRRGGRLCPCLAEASWVQVDGLDATEAIAGLVSQASERLGLAAVLLDTPVFAGFNVAEPWRVHEETGVPVVVVYAYPPRRRRVERALRLHFPDWRRRLGVLEEVWSRLRRAPCPRGELLYASYGLDAGEAWRLLCSLQVYTRIPEPLYTAHVVASGLSRSLLGGVSR